MFGFKGRKKEAPGPVAALAASDQMRQEMGLPLEKADSPWTQAQRYNDDRFLRLAAQVANWRLFAFLMVGLAAMGVGGAVYIGSQSKIIPYLVEVDKLGHTRAVRALDGGDAVVDPKRTVYREMIEWVEHVRTVSSDRGANNKFLNRAFSRLVGAAKVYVREELQSRKPDDVAQTRTIQIEVKTALPVSEKSWQVEWEETSYNLKGERMGTPERWKANVTFELSPSQDAGEMDQNPSGFYINQVSWTRQL